ncbi:MAG: uridine diphosphate-N-acetylglucosamine-binding protein YvcK, partial [Nitriliruptor sp.]
VTVADDGGSSGRLRRDHDIVAPGDLRMALATLARDRDLADLIQYRFSRGELDGHSLGNLILVTLQDLSAGDVVEGLDRLARLLDVPGRVLPCTTVPVTLQARADGGLVDGQAAVATTSHLRQVWLDPTEPPATPAAVAAVRRADLVVLGPGSLFTSVLPNLLVPGIARAIAASEAPTVLVANLREQPGETEGLSLPAHLDALTEHVPGLRVDVLIAHDGPGPHEGKPLTVDLDALAERVDEVVVTDLFDGRNGHDPVALAARFGELLAR